MAKEAASQSPAVGDSCGHRAGSRQSTSEGEAASMFQSVNLESSLVRLMMERERRKDRECSDKCRGEWERELR